MRTDWWTIGGGAGGTVATIGLDRFNGYVAALCGVITAALLARRLYITVRDDVRRKRESKDVKLTPDSD